MTSEKSKTHIISVWGQAVLFPCLLSAFIPVRLPALLSRVAQVLIWYLVICIISPGIGFWDYYSCCVCTGIISGIMGYSSWLMVLEFSIFLGARTYLVLSPFVVDSKTKNNVSCHKPQQIELFIIIYTGYDGRYLKDSGSVLMCLRPSIEVF